MPQRAKCYDKRIEKQMPKLKAFVPEHFRSLSLWEVSAVNPPRFSAALAFD
jgi:hypothetical protein